MATFKIARNLFTRTRQVSFYRQQSRLYSREATDTKSKFSRKKLLFGSLTGISAIAAIAAAVSSYKQSDEIAMRPLSHLSLKDLIRRYLVYSCCSFPTLIDWSPKLIDWARSTSIMGVNATCEWIMKHTFFKQFVGGETAEECKKVILSHSRHGIGAILVYSAEADKQITLNNEDCQEYLYNHKVKEILHSIDIAGECNEEDKSSVNVNNVMIAVKLSGLLKDSNVLERASAAILPRERFSEPPATIFKSNAARGASPELMIPVSALNEKDVNALKALFDALQSFSNRARKSNIRILIDAEYSWMQPAIDALFESCARIYNRKSDRLPLIYNTYQAYLRRTPAYLTMSLERARKGGYNLGVKLVRGAYVDQENSLWSKSIVKTPPGVASNAEKGSEPGHWQSPVWPTKQLTDDCYDSCAKLLIDVIANENTAAVVFAGHNWKSAMLNIDQMLSKGIAVKNGDENKFSEYFQGRIHLAQLYGMADDLTFAIQKAFNKDSHVALKYIPYGNLTLVMPYLTRRAQENKSVMSDGRAGRERSAVLNEIRTRIGFL